MGGRAVSERTRRGIVLASIILSALIVSIDSTVMSVAIPTMLREFDTTLSELQWVLTGYSLVFAALLVIGGRLGDLYGHRRVFALGGWVFAAGSFLAMVSWSVPSLFVGYSLIEGIGACLMLPSAMALLSNGFQGPARANAFAMLGVAIGVGVALGPLLGGFFTSQLSWRFAFGINVLVTPLAVFGVRALSTPDASSQRRRLDLIGALLLSTGLLALVFGLSEGGRYGYWRQLAPLEVGELTIWPDRFALSVVPAAFVVAGAFLLTFVVIQRRKERAGRDPLIQLSMLRRRRYRYGVLTTAILAIGQLGMMIVLSVVLQGAVRLSPLEVGVWLIPFGLAIVLGARLGAVVTNRTDGVRAVQLGIVLELGGLAWIALQLGPDVHYLALLPGLVVYGLGIGTSSAQLNNVILSDVDPAQSGVASGTASTVRQVGSAIGVASVSTILTVQALSLAASNFRATDVRAPVRERAIAVLDEAGTGFEVPVDADPDEGVALLRALAEGISDASRPALLFGLGVAAAGLLVALVIPRRSTTAVDPDVVPAEVGGDPPAGVIPSSRAV